MMRMNNLLQYTALTIEETTFGSDFSLTDTLTETEWPGYFGQIITLMTKAVDYVRDHLPIDDAAIWLQTNVPLFADFEQPAVVLGIGMLALWVAGALVSNFFRTHVKTFVVGIAVIGLAVYMGLI